MSRLVSAGEDAGSIFYTSTFVAFAHTKKRKRKNEGTLMEFAKERDGRGKAV